MSVSADWIQEHHTADESMGLILAYALSLTESDLRGKPFPPLAWERFRRLEPHQCVELAVRSLRARSQRPCATAHILTDFSVLNVRVEPELGFTLLCQKPVKHLRHVLFGFDGKVSVIWGN